MPKYMIEILHAQTECDQSMDEVAKTAGAEAITHVYWGCMHGTHSGWILLEVSSPDEALDMVTGEFLRPKARVYEVENYTSEQLESMHRAA